MAVIDHRVRRPDDKHDLIERLANEEEAVFPTMRELFVFAAVLGKAEGERAPFSKSSKGDPIRLEYFYKVADYVLLFETLAVLEHPTDAEILREDRLAEVVTIFEEYANGGLEIMQGEFNTNRLRPVDEVLLDVVMREIGRDRTVERVDLSRVADELFV